MRFFSLQQYVDNKEWRNSVIFKLVSGKVLYIFSHIIIIEFLKKYQYKKLKKVR